MTNELEIKLNRAKSQLVLENPFLASLLLTIPVEITERLPFPTAATDGKWVGLHPKWVGFCNLRQLKWTLAHEVMHCVLKHFFRIGNRKSDKWNYAGDVVINALLEEDKIGERPPGVIWRPDLYVEGKTTEGVYSLLPDEPPSGGGGSGDGEGGGGGYPQWDDCQPMPGDPSEVAEASADWDVRIAQAAAAAKMCGRLSANMERFVKEVLKPRVKWQDVLREFFTKRAHVERTFARPNRRFAADGLYLPGKGGHTVGDVVIFVDLSGSISQREADEFAAEMNGIKEDCNPAKTHLIYFTSRVMDHHEFEADETLEITMNGTGGTAFSPMFRYVNEHQIEPMAGVVLTDLECSDFGPAPDYPVLWCSTSKREAPWGEVIMLRETHQ
jgi:predicted metal-dependent peptidase